MSIRVRCPRCWETAEIPEDALGKQGRCNSCGALVALPKRLTKVCFICGRDVTASKHAKDADSNYICANCRDTRRPDEQALFSDVSRECYVCHGHVGAGETLEHDGKPICRACLDQVSAPKKDEKPQDSKDDHPLDKVHDDPGHDHPHADEEHHDHVDLKSPAGEPVMMISRPASDAGSRSSAAALMVACVALLAVGGLFVWQTNRDRWEDENRAKVIVLKAQAETLIALGKVPEGLEKYNELFRFVDKQQVRSAALNREIEAAKAAAKLARGVVIDTWEEDHKLKIVVLKSQADLLTALGKHREGIDKYTELLRLVASRTIDNPMLVDELNQAQKGLEMARAAKKSADEADARAAAAAAQARREAEIRSRPPVATVNPLTPPSTQPVAVGPTTLPPPIFVGPAPTTQPIETGSTQVHTAPPDQPVKPPLKSIFDY